MNNFINKFKTFFNLDKSIDFNKNYLNQHIVGMSGIIIIVISCFLPFARVGYQIKSKSLTFFDFYGFILIILMIICALMLCSDKYKLAMLPALIGGAIILYSIFALDAYLDKLDLDYINSGLYIYSPGISLYKTPYFMAFGFILIFIDFYLAKNRN